MQINTSHYEKYEMVSCLFKTATFDFVLDFLRSQLPLGDNLYFVGLKWSVTSFLMGSDEKWVEFLFVLVALASRYLFYCWFFPYIFNH